MKNQVMNPYLPLNEYVPDGEPHVFGDRIYIFGSHDKENGQVYCMLDYVSYSAPLDDLSDWRYEGVIYRKEQDPHYAEGVYIWAPDVCQGPDGRYYLYYTTSTELEIAVAVCDEPAGRYEYLGRISYADGTVLRENTPFDAAVLNDDGRIFLYYGFAPHFPIARMQGVAQPGASVVELETDMLTVKVAPKVIIPARKFASGTSFEGHAFFEAASMRKINGMYYMIYDSELAHELCYAVSDRPDGGFEFGGPVISNADVGYNGNTLARNCNANNHGGLECVNGQWYIFYHRHTHAHQCSRQGCAEKVFLDENGKIKQVQMTSCGLNPDALKGQGTYNAAYACNLYEKDGGKSLPYGKKLEGVPAVVSENGVYIISGMNGGSTAVFRYFDLTETKSVYVKVRGSSGILKVEAGSGYLSEIKLKETTGFEEYETEINCSDSNAEFKLIYEGNGRIDIQSFTFR